MNINKLDIQSETLQSIIPKDTANIIEEAEESLEDKTNETLILDTSNEELYKEDKKSKSNNLKYFLGMILFLGITIFVLFFFNKFQIINLNFDEIISSGYSLIDLILKKLLFYFSSFAQMILDLFNF